MLCRAVLLSIGFALLSGCAERARVVTIPPGAKLFLEGREVGTTPYVLSLERDELRDIPYRVELDPYRPAEGTLKKAVAPGRAVGAAFTLGILYLFRSPYYISSAREILALQPGLISSGSSAPVPIEERLKRLKELRDQGVLSSIEYEEQRARILEEDRARQR